MSECRDPQNRSHKACVCGGHSTRDRKRHKRKPTRETVRHPETTTRTVW